MKENREIAIRYIKDDEGGYTERAGEPGGAVNHGISFLTFGIWWKQIKRPGVPTFDDLKNISDEDVNEIYETNFADKIGFDILPAGVDYAALDSAANEGVSFTNALLTLTRGIDDATTRIKAISDTRLYFKKLKPSWNKFKGGWTQRIGVDVPARSNAMAGKATK